MKRSLLFVISGLIILSMLLAACGTQATPVPPAETEAPPAETEAPPPASAEPIKIGSSLPITGGFAINGQKHKDGYQLCVDLINEKGGLLGRQVELLVSDNQSDADTAIAQTERMINVDKVELIFGTFSSALTFPMTSITEQAKMVHPIPAGAALRIYSRGYKYIFYFQQNAAEFVGKTPIEMIKDLVPAGEQPTTAAVVHADDFFANAIAAGLMGGQVTVEGLDNPVEIPSALDEAGIEVVFSQQWPETGFSDWINLANSLKAANADLVMGLTASPDETIQLVRAMQTVGYQPKGVYLSQGTQEEFKEGVGDAVNGIMIHSAWHPNVDFVGELAGEPFSNSDFIAAFQAKFNRMPDEDEAIPFSLCMGMEQAVRGVGSTDNDAIREWFASRTAETSVKTILGEYHWDERGLPIGRPFLMTQWQDGELKFVYPVGEFPGTSDLLWPKPEW
ncbi:MAG TPA: amino acid ABC transporter substrate-binding protein [Anaerolineales bacterium]|nr:amino acid ABC transporter substrate-binding protein [Anaerolineales bacterium]